MFTEFMALFRLVLLLWLFSTTQEQLVLALLMLAHLSPAHLSTLCVAYPRTEFLLTVGGAVWAAAARGGG